MRVCETSLMDHVPELPGTLNGSAIDSGLEWRLRCKERALWIPCWAWSREIRGNGAQVKERMLCFSNINLHTGHVRFC